MPTREKPSPEVVPDLLTLSDVMGTGWFGAEAAGVKPGSTVVVVGDGAVGLLGIPSAREMGAEPTGPAVPAEAHRPRRDGEVQPGEGVRSDLALDQVAEGYGPWTSDVPSRRCCAPDENAPSYAFEPQVAEDLRRGSLRLVLEPYAAPVPGFFLYFPSRAQVSPALRAFVR